MPRTMVEIDGRYVALDGRLAAIVRSVVGNREEIERHGFCHVALDCRPRGVKLSITKTWPVVEVSTVEHG